MAQGFARLAEGIDRSTIGLDGSADYRWDDVPHAVAIAVGDGRKREAGHRARFQSGLSINCGFPTANSPRDQDAAERKTAQRLLVTVPADAFDDDVDPAAVSGEPSARPLR